MNRVRLIARRPPAVDDHQTPAERLEWVSNLIGVKHSPDDITKHLALMWERRLWLPDTPEVIPSPPVVFNGFVVAEQPGLFYGAEKTLKTSLMAHLSVCVAGRQTLFGQFEVDRSHAGAVVQWTVEGGSTFVLDRLDRACSIYGLRRKTLPIEVQTTPYPLNSNHFLYTLADQMERLDPALTIVEPLYLMPPLGWDGSRLSTFDVGHFTSICSQFRSLPILGHHDKRGEGDGLRKSSGVGPAEWAGQWWHIQRTTPWDTSGPHRLRVTHGARGAGGGRWGLLVDDDTLEVEVVAATDVDPERPTKEKVFDMLRTVLPDVLDGRSMGTGDLFDTLAGHIEARYGRNPTGSTLRRHYLDLLISHGDLRTVTKTKNEHIVERGSRPDVSDVE
jgi:hypothetical protein